MAITAASRRPDGDEDRLRSFDTIIENPSDKEVVAKLAIFGLWGSELEVAGVTVTAQDGTFKVPVTLSPNSTMRVRGRITR